MIVFFEVKDMVLEAALQKQIDAAFHNARIKSNHRKIGKNFVRLFNYFL